MPKSVEYHLKVKPTDDQTNDKWRGHCLDCNYSVEGDHATVMSKGVDHEIENPGHWVEKEKI